MQGFDTSERSTVEDQRSRLKASGAEAGNGVHVAKLGNFSLSAQAIFSLSRNTAGLKQSGSRPRRITLQGIGTFPSQGKSSKLSL
jgi:hypothetical protein